uniref:Dynein-1, subspecies f n=1 Tax=Albugo laibachii Nc14 TaxID=890382 RepID=F0WJ37_9STRA|nr:inner dynein arm heavy chain 1beta putative [Albugo laibachii Nc14]CCA21656.1 dynein heavy chain 2 putative [Albugo laibachii Nc14]|eukprot:CCA21656.1 dynein heavy chain 2 putative [Albugo laibachii Nc14]
MEEFEDVDFLMQWIRDRINLPGYRPSDWTSANATAAKEFIDCGEIPALFMIKETNGLKLSTVAPRSITSAIMYFVKVGDVTISPQTVHYSLQYGTVQTDSIGSLLQLMSGYYMERIRRNASWPESIRKEFTTQFYRFMSSLTETVSRSCGKTILYLPPWDIDGINLEDKELMQQLESTVIHWTRQIKEMVNNQDEAFDTEDAGPLKEIQFWKLRTQDLSGITDQLVRPDIQAVIGVLRSTKSSYIQPFEVLANIITQGSIEANDNLRFLKKVSPICEELSRASPSEVPPLLPKLLNVIRLIWLYSTYYNTEDRITSLLRKISNEVIAVCCRKISLQDILNANVQESMIYLEQSVQCGILWKQMFHGTSAAVKKSAKSNGRCWDFDETGIFAQTDAFVQRCRELLEVCEGQMQFATHGKHNSRQTLPIFGGHRGPEIVQSLYGIEKQFENHIQRLRVLKYDILDVKITSWHSDFNTFKNGMKDLEAMTQNVINGAFESVSTIVAAVDLVLAFRTIARREHIKRCLEKKVLDIFGMYKAVLNTVRTMFEKHKQAPPLNQHEPQYAGAALWARALLMRSTEDIAYLRKLPSVINSIEKKEVQQLYNQFRLVIIEYIQRKHHDWIEELNEMSSISMFSRLEVPLLVKVSSSSETGQQGQGNNTKGILVASGKDQMSLKNTRIQHGRKGFLNCNFDRYLLLLFTEVHYWQFFQGGLQIPYLAHEICTQREQLRILREHVMLLVRDYNRILLDLSSRERRLFDSIIRRLDRRIQPGLQKLTWVSKGIVESYIADCRKNCELTYQVVQDFQHSKEIVSRNCKMIASLLHICIGRNTTYDEGVFELKQNAHRKVIESKLKDAYDSIVLAIRAACQHFGSGPSEVQREWNRFIERCDRMIEDALRQSVKKSLQELSKAINGDLKTDPRPLFRIHVVLEDSRVEFKPLMASLSQMVNNIAKDIFTSVSAVPTLSSSMGASSISPSSMQPEKNLEFADVVESKLDEGKLKPDQALACTDTLPGDNQADAVPQQTTKEELNAAEVAVAGLGSDTAATLNEQINHYQTISKDEEIMKILTHIGNGISFSATEMQKYVGYWDKYKLLWNQDKQAFIRRYAKANRPLQQFRADIERYREQQQNIQNEDLTNTINFMQIDTNLLKASLAEHTVQWIAKLTGLLNQIANDELYELLHMLKKTSEKLGVKPTNLNHLAESIRLLQDVKENLPHLSSRFEPLEQKYELLSEFDCQVSDEEIRDLQNLKVQREAYELMISEANTMLQKCKLVMKQQLQDTLMELNTIMSDLRSEADSSLPYNAEVDSISAQKTLMDFDSKLKSTKARQAVMKTGLEIFGLEEMKHEGFAQVERDILNLKQMWTLKDEWEAVWATWKSQSFYEVDVEKIEATASRFEKKVVRLGKEMKQWSIWTLMRAKTLQFRQTLPLIQDLKSPALRPRHWMQLKVEVGKSFDFEADDFTLEQIFLLEFHTHSEFIGILSSNAVKELSIEQALDNMEKHWSVTDIDLVEYKGIYHKIGFVSDLFSILEDDQVQLSSMKASTFYTSFESRITHWESVLTQVSEVIETLLAVQRSWVYLESIFMVSEDIRKQLPLESKMFDDMNSLYCTVTEGIMKKKNAIEATQSSQLLSTLQHMQVKLDEIQKSLDQYLETKRAIFPRFYFLSNDDLLDILGHQKDPEQVQKHIKKCFEAIKSLTLIPPGGARGNIFYEAAGMNSPCGEQVTFSSNVVISGAVEGWLVRIQAAMVGTLEKMFAQCLSGYKTKKEKWLRDSPGQLLITCGQTIWTNECIKALNEVSKGEKKALKALKKKWLLYLNKLADIGRSALSSVERKKIVALITTEIHSRDVIERLVKQNCKSVTDFDWLMQLRYYFNKEIGDSGICEVKQTVSSLQYSYEYQGNNGRLVLTPLTDRCILTMTTALHLNRGGNPLGPAGTGKTETVKDLGKNLAKYVIVFNCSDGLDYKSVGRMFSGLLQSGGWGCFDEFNRIEIEVLSVVAQQVLTIMQALASKQTHLNLLGTSVRCNHNMGIFITMNPGYAGRTELPDNLKALMRPCAMMVPDLSLIAEVMLQAEGFRDARALAKKINTLYGLMAQQLSKQDHYDFGLRSLKTVLCMAGGLKRSEADTLEECIILKALDLMNSPKLIPEDTSIFSLLLADLFPGVEVPSTSYRSLEEAVTQQLKNQNMQLEASIIHKTIQLHESQLSRHCNMIVGQTMAGKSTIWKTLQGAKTKLAKDGNADFIPVRVQVLNPKSITLNELYGVYDLSTSVWIDGILSAIFRAAAADTKMEENWIILDGPVDTLWIESINSVMDDNKVLTLVNGERISMNANMALLFEVQDLAVASPATVSRAGMIYMDVKDLGWRPYVKSWLSISIKDEGERGILSQLFDKYLDKTLHCKVHMTNEAVSTTVFNSVKSFCNLYCAFICVENEADKASLEEKNPLLIEKCFLFCLTWSVMAAANEEGRKKLDLCLRDTDTIYPPLKTAYDFYIDMQVCEFRLWDEKLSPNFRIAPTTNSHQIIVPTVDTLRYGFLLQTLLNAGIHFLIVGKSGVGKSTITHQELSSLDESTFQYLAIYFSSATSSAKTQYAIEGAMEKRSLNRFGPLNGKKLVTFIDDLNMPKKDEFGSQPPLELLRHWMDYGCWYDRKKQTLKHLVDMQLAAAMGPPGGGRSTMCPRFQSRFHLINFTFPEQTQLKRIFETMMSSKLAEFDEEVRTLCTPIVTATISLYQSVVEFFHPTPTNCHYVFNLRDMVKVVQGLLSVKKHDIAGRDGMVRLWMHESIRVFNDRLTNTADRRMFKRKIDELLSAHFQTDWNRVLSSFPEQCKENGPLFTYFPIAGATTRPAEVTTNDEDPHYTEIMETKQLKRFVEYQLENHNAEPGMIPMNLVMFGDALLHILRIHRVLLNPLGNLLLVGVGGSGRQSLTRLAAFIAGYKVFQIEVLKKYHTAEFYQDIKKLFEQTGVNEQTTVFLFNDTQVKQESFLADLNNLLSSGEVPGLYDKDEQAAIIEAVRIRARACGIKESKESLWSFFINSVRANLHLVLTFSPIGRSFRDRCREFPSLVNNTTIDWFDEWPSDALQEVAMKYLEEENLVTDEQRLKISSVFAAVHSSVALASQQLYQTMKRHNYVTPTNYLALVTGYLELYREKQQAILQSRDTLDKGLTKLEESRRELEVMSKQLENRKIVVAQKNKDCSDLLVVIVSERRVADEQRKQVEADSERISSENVETLGIADEAQRDLDEALPVLQKAMLEVENLDKKAIAEVKVYSQPPESVSMVMCAVMILFGLQPTWAQAKTKMNDVNFLQQIKTFDKDGIKDKTVVALKKYTTKPNFQPDIIRKVSAAAGALCSWVLAMESYAGVFRVVAPKKEALKKSQNALSIKQNDLELAKNKLEDVTLAVENLKRQYDASVAEKNALREEADLLELKLSRAEQLVKGLAGEHERWKLSIAEKNENLINVLGDALVAAAFISYAGPFDSYFRSSLLDTWINRVTQQTLPISPRFSFTDFLADPVDVRAWDSYGLPTDSLSTENGVITTRSKRWPLMIDPQGQANKWIRAMEGPTLKVVDPGMKDCLRNLENGIRFGHPVLMQDVFEDLDPSLEPVLSKSIIRIGQREIIRIGDMELDYNRQFRLYLTTRMQNPHYRPEISTKTTIINFVVKEQGLEAQLLGITVQLEEPALEDQKSDLVVRVAAAKKKLIDLENEILRLLSAAKGSLLDDEVLVNTLNASKITSEEVTSRLHVSQATEEKIDEARMGYKDVAIRSSTVYFVLNDLTRIDPMYQFSLDSYIDRFKDSIINSRTLKNQASLTDKLVLRIDAINDYHTYAVYCYTCRGLFERHKLLFSLLLCVRILKKMNKISAEEYDFLLKGTSFTATTQSGEISGSAKLIARVTHEEKIMNAAADYLNDTIWKSLVDLSHLPRFQGLISSFEQNNKAWKAWFQSKSPEVEPLPADWEGKCNDLQKMLLLRCMRHDRLSIQAARFTANHLGAHFVDPPSFDLKSIYASSTYKTPLIFILSPGIDPTNALMTLADSMMQKVENCALGQGQADIADGMLRRGIETGCWVFLANCHLMLSWASTLEKWIETNCNDAHHNSGTTVNTNFRLWLSSDPTPKFPMAVLQRGIKMTTEPPHGIKSNLLRLYNTFTVSKFNRCHQQKKYKRLLFCLCWFHSLLLERRKFKKLGWNIPYDFNESDFLISEDVLAIYLAENEETPWDALKYLIAQVNYGGRVTDDWDRRLMLVYISQLFTDDIMSVDNAQLSESEHYYVPNDGDLSSYVDFIKQLPLSDPPAAFGQHANAQIASQIEEGRELLSTILSLQMNAMSENTQENDEKVLNGIQTLRKTVPEIFNVDSVKMALQVRDDPDALKAVLIQELDRYNKLLECIHTFLDALERGIEGIVVITPELEDVYSAILLNKVPKAWGFCYPSLKPLASWTQELQMRCEQLCKWANIGLPAVFWLTGFTYPTQFLTALFQMIARKNGISIDALNWEFVIMNQNETALTTPPADGAYVKGLILEGARWDFEHDTLAEPYPMELHCQMPIIHFKPVETKKKFLKGYYSCPLYIHPIRAGTRERPSFIITLELKCGPGRSPDLWTKRGTALLLSMST